MPLAHHAFQDTAWRTLMQREEVHHPTPVNNKKNGLILHRDKCEIVHCDGIMFVGFFVLCYLPPVNRHVYDVL